MPNYQGSITNLVSGDWRQIPWTVTNVPENGSITKGWLTVKANETDADAAAIFQKIITTVLDVDEGLIQNTGQVGNIASGYFNLTMADTILLTPLTTYFYDLQFLITMTDLTTRVETPEKGTLSTLQGITDAVS